MRNGIHVNVSSAERTRLEAVVADRSSPQKHVWRARIILLTGDGLGTAEIMRRTGKSKPCVWRWQERFMHEGVGGLLRDKTRPSRIPPLPGAIVKRVVELTSTEPPGETTHWTAAAMAKVVGISISSVQRVWQAHKLRPHRVRHFKLSTDPEFVTKLRDIVGLYVDPPAHAVVLSVDEKSQIQALDRTQPGLPLKKGRCGTITHDYKRNGTTTLFAALDVLEGKVIGRCMQRHRHQEFIRFLNAIEAEVPAGKIVHVILDNYGTHKHPKVVAWLERHPRFVFHFTPTSCSWAQCRRNLLRQAQQTPTQKRSVPLDRQSPDRHQPLHRRNQRRPHTVRLDRQSQQDRRRRQTWAPSVRFDPLADSRTGKNGWHGVVGLLRQSVFGRLAGYEDVNDADRLGRDPAMRWVVGGKAVERGGASTSQMGRFETELLTIDDNLAALTALPGVWIEPSACTEPAEDHRARYGQLR